MSRAILVALVAALPACGTVRFVDRAPVWQEHDDAPIALPAERPPSVDWSTARELIVLPIDRALALDYGVEAVEVNALDEPPESTWFHDPRGARAGRPRPLGDEEMAWGAARPDDAPVPPLTVVKAKAVGASAGFVATDARGVRYMIKLDPPGRPGFATAVEVVVSRLAWACGWLVPREVMLALPPSELRVSKKATAKDELGVARPFREADLERLLAGVAVDGDGRVSMLASRWLDGVNLGPFRYEGRRGDDPNDRFPHENRRTLRGFAVFAAWVNDIDTLENNTLDMYEGAPGRGHVVHYQQDVGGAFGVWAFQAMKYWMGHESYFDLPHIFRALVGLGLSSGHWDEQRFRAAYDARLAASPALGAFDAEHFDPRGWRPTVPNAAFARATARDRYWAAKRIALVDARELRAAISAGHYPPPVADALFDILWQRRDKLLRAWLGDVTPLDWFRIDGARLCFDDVWYRAGLGGADAGGCVDLPTARGYHVIAITAHAPGRPTRAPVRVHVVVRGDDRRIVGVER